MPHSINKDKCKAEATCANACPVSCIQKSSNKHIHGSDFYFVDFSTCIDCGVCLEVCPVEGAVIPEERRDLQTDN